jgi:starch phosphorylase
MEIALRDDIPTYSGGLGVLAGDTLRAAVDLQIPMVGVTLVHRRGYFRQQLDESGRQTEHDAIWNPADYLERVDSTVFVAIEGRRIAVRAWTFQLSPKSPVYVYLLDTDLPENSDWDRSLTDHLYGGDEHYRLCQEVVLGMGGIALLEIEDTPEDLASLYDKLEGTIIPMFYSRPDAYDQIMRMALALNGSFFNTQRMLSQYVTNAYNLR